VGASYFTFFRRGLAFLAAGDALRVAEARMAPATAELTPCFFAIDCCTALNPGWLFMIDLDYFDLRFDFEW